MKIDRILTVMCTVCLWGLPACDRKASNPTNAAESQPIPWPPEATSPAFSVDSASALLDHRFHMSGSGMTGLTETGGIGMPLDEEAVRKMREGYGLKPDDPKGASFKSFEIKLQLVSNLGSAKVEAQADRWVKLSDAKGASAGWGAVLTSGQVIIPRSQAFKTDSSVRFANHFTLAALNDEYCLITLQEEAGDQLLLRSMPGDNGENNWEVVPNSEGTQAVAGSAVYEIRSDGWYLDGRMAHSFRDENARQAKAKQIQDARKEKAGRAEGEKCRVAAENDERSQQDKIPATLARIPAIPVQTTNIVNAYNSSVAGQQSIETYFWAYVLTEKGEPYTRQRSESAAKLSGEQIRAVIAHARALMATSTSPQAKQP